jgi:hypothetical protein
MEERNLPRADFITSFILIAFGSSVLITSLRMPRLEEQQVNPFSVPGLVPGLVGVIIAFLGLVLLVRSIRRKGYLLGVSGESARGFLAAEATRRFALTILLSVIYALGMLGRMPYPLATVLYVFAFIVVFEYRRGQSLASQWKRVALAAFIAVVTAGAVTGVFRYAFYVTLPR